MFPYDHDLHCHTTLSNCCHDEGMTKAALYENARARGIRVRCTADHLWDADVQGVTQWYSNQDIAHISQILPLPASEETRLWFGCEIEYRGEGRFSLAREHFEPFDFIVVALNHFHMEGVSLPEGVRSEEDIARVFTRRIVEISNLTGYPFSKMGIAHLTTGLTCRWGDPAKVFERMDEAELFPAFQRIAKNGMGVELNNCAFRLMESAPDACLKLYRIAKRAGCKFYYGSDAHSVASLEKPLKPMESIAEALGLTPSDRMPLLDRFA